MIDRRNILVSGGTGTGKTTLLNMLSSFIPFKERIVTIEDTTELRLHQEHVVTLETKPPNIEGAGEYTVRDLVKNALRMRPDRIIVGECRGPEALDMIQAMNTGHDGSMTTVHANSSPRSDRAAGSAGADGGRSAGDLDPSPTRLGVGPDRPHQPAARRGEGRSHKSPKCSATIPTRSRSSCTTFSISATAQSLRPTGYLPSFIDSLVEKELLELEFLYGREAGGRPAMART